MTINGLQGEESHAEEMANVSSDTVHIFLGGGKAADILLWRKKKVSFLVLSVSSFVWAGVDLLGLHFINLMSYVFSTCFLLSCAVGSGMIHDLTQRTHTPYHIPEVCLPMEPFLEAALDIHTGINHALDVLSDISIKIDFKRYILVCCGLILLSYVGGWVTSLTFCYVVIVLLFTVPIFCETWLALYKKYGGKFGAHAKNCKVLPRFSETSVDR